MVQQFLRNVNGRTIQPRSQTVMYLLNWFENLHLHKNLKVNIYSKFIRNAKFILQ